jgi:hypothetical protein
MRTVGRWLVLVIVLGLLAGCSSDPTTSPEYKALASEKDTALSDLAAREAELQTAQADLQTARDQLASLEADLEASRAQGEALATEKSDMETSISDLNGKVADLESAVADIEDERDAALAEVERLQVTYDEEIRADLQAAFDAEAARACEQAKEQWDDPIAGMVRFNSDWEPIGTREDLIAAVTECSGEARAMTAEQREAERLAACKTGSVDELEKNPDAYRGDCVHLWANIVQWDSNTGTCSFRAEMSSYYSTAWYDYSGNGWFNAKKQTSCPELEGIDNDDFVEVWATGAGTYTYSTTIGGSATATVWTIEKIVLKRKD